jgi:carbonic anhydrase
MRTHLTRFAMRRRTLMTADTRMLDFAPTVAMCARTVTAMEDAMHQPTRGGRWTRRAFAAITVLSLAGLTAWAARLLNPPAGAAPAKGARVDPDGALRRLMEGNDRFVKGLTQRRDLSVRRMALVEAQFPLAALLACADSRVSPEYVFDADLGDLFITRTAGNYLSPDDLATLEYAVYELGTPLLVVVGHASCGAVKAAVQVAEQGVQLPGHLGLIAEAIMPAVQTARRQTGDVVMNAVRENVALNVTRLRTAEPLVAPAVRAGKVKVAGAVYDLQTGRAEFLP